MRVRILNCPDIVDSENLRHLPGTKATVVRRINKHGKDFLVAAHDGQTYILAARHFEQIEEVR